MNEAASRETPLVAILEDDSFQRTWFERLLERASFRVRSYADPRDFLARRGERPLPEVLLLDIVLMDMDAFQVLAELEEDVHWCQVPVVLMTASATMDRVIAVQRLALRPEGLLAKPVDIRSTLILLRTICDGQDPSLRLRRLRRQQRSEQIFIRHTLKEMDKPVGGDEEIARTYARRRVEALRRAQELRLREATARPVGPERDRLAAQIRAAEAEAERYRTKVRSDESARRETLATDITLHRKHLEELEEEISALTTGIPVLTSDAPPTDSPAEVVAPLAREEPDSASEAA